MDFNNQLRGLGEKVESLKPHINTEESTKHAFVLPFINILGFDTFNPLEVVPEFTADVGTKKGEKVDYAIFQNGEPILIIECKHWNSDLNINNASQLFRYFTTTKTRFALLTNGIVYKFYTDLVEPNKMDEKPFLEFDITNLKDNVIREVEKFHKFNFDVNKIIGNASVLKYISEMKNLIESEISDPSNEFVKYFANQIYSGRMTANVLEEFKEITKKAFSQYVSDKINDRLISALSKEKEKQKEDEVSIEPVEDSKIFTTEEEIEAFNIVVAILRRKISKERIVYRDTQSYFGILLDNNNRKPITRLYLNGGTKYICLFDKDKKETKEKIETIDDIYKFEKELLSVIDYYDAE